MATPACYATSKLHARFLRAQEDLTALTPLLQRRLCMSGRQKVDGAEGRDERLPDDDDLPEIDDAPDLDLAWDEDDDAGRRRDPLRRP
jgi:hypothetical protein